LHSQKTRWGIKDNTDLHRISVGKRFFVSLKNMINGLFNCAWQRCKRIFGKANFQEKKTPIQRKGGFVVCMQI
jgi:hypothetical protein